MLVDTHVHLYLDRFDADRDAVVARAREAGVTTFLQPAIDVPSVLTALDLCARYEGLYAMAALHPTETREAEEADLAEVAAACDDPHIVAVGEGGISR